MSRIADRFAALSRAQRKALVVYVVAGDPKSETTVPLMHAMVEAGADLIELGVPFSDPEAEGPVIQAACERALARGTTLEDVLAMVAKFRERDDRTPVLLMGYLNPLEVLGYERFAAAAARCGVDGTIIVNLPPEESEPLVSALRAHEIDPVFLLAPTTTLDRARKICAASRGFVYYVSLKGVTGAASLDVGSVADKLAVFRSVSTLPVAVGFGIKDGASAAAVAQLADGVAVGSALVAIVADHVSDPALIPEAVAQCVREIRGGIDGA